MVAVNVHRGEFAALGWTFASATGADVHPFPITALRWTFADGSTPAVAGGDVDRRSPDLRPPQASSRLGNPVTGEVSTSAPRGPH